MDSNPKPPDSGMSVAMADKPNANVGDEKNILNHFFRTPPYDPRFPNTNQSLYCWVSYLKFHKCEKSKGKGNEMCQYYKDHYTSLCPESWIDRWDTQLEEGRFVGNI